MGLINGFGGIGMTLLSIINKDKKMNGIIFLCYRTLILISIGFGGGCVKAQIIEKYNVETQNKDTIKVIPEVVIQKNKNKNIGLRSKSQKIVFAIYPNRNKDSLYKEFATKLTTNKEIRIRSININIAQFVTKTPVRIEVNIYNEKNGIPNESILKEKLIVVLDKSAIINNELRINVEDKEINLKGTFFIGFKILDYFDGHIYVSGGLLKGGFSRKKGESWQKILFVSPSVNLDVFQVK